MTVTPTLGELLARHHREVLDHLDRNASIPAVTVGRQGDVLVCATIDGAEGTAVPPEGVVLVRGSNDHVLLADGDVRWEDFTMGDLIDEGGPSIGMILVAEGATAYLLHPEHGALAMVGPANYEVIRQREWRGRDATVAD